MGYLFICSRPTFNSCKRKNLNLNLEQRDISINPPEPASFDVIVISRFLDRNLMPHIKNAIKTSGLIFYQTFIVEKTAVSGSGNSDYLLKNNELLTMFTDWNIIYYREEGKTGDIKNGFRNQAMIIAQKISI